MSFYYVINIKIFWLVFNKEPFCHLFDYLWLKKKPPKFGKINLGIARVPLFQNSTTYTLFICHVCLSNGFTFMTTCFVSIDRTLDLISFSNFSRLYADFFSVKDNSPQNVSSFIRCGTDSPKVLQIVLSLFILKEKCLAVIYKLQPVFLTGVIPKKLKIHENNRKKSIL